MRKLLAQTEDNGGKPYDIQQYANANGTLNKRDIVELSSSLSRANHKRFCLIAQ
nr:MAG TPA: hypothetical protein [Caudoviricetes sp.]